MKMHALFVKEWQEFKAAVEAFNTDPYRPKGAKAGLSFDDFVYWLENGTVNYDLQ